MKHQQTHKSSSWNPFTQEQSTQFAPRPFAVQAQHNSLEPATQEGTQSQAFDSHSLERASQFGHNLSNISVHAPAVPPVQAKLTIGAPGDKYEQEADRVAAQVVRQINAPVSALAQRQPVQRQEESEEKLQAKPNISKVQRSLFASAIQRAVIPEQHILQRREAIGGGDASANLESAIDSARGSGQPLDTGLQQSMGQAMGADFSGVRVHADAQSDQLNRSIQAKAFTTGQDMFFRQGAYQPESRSGQELIAHELTHVVQQNGNTVQTKLACIQRDDEADVVPNVVQHEADEDFAYGKYKESAVNTKVVLRKDKKFYQGKGSTPYKDSKGNDEVIEKGTLVKVLEDPSSDGKFSRSWAKIEKGDKQGWVNTKASLSKDRILGHDSAGVIMPDNPTVDDVKQGMHGDCFLLAALASLVQNNPEFIKNKLFVTDPTKDAEEHRVRFFKFTNYDAGKPRKDLTFAPQDVTVKNTILKIKTQIIKSSETIEQDTPVGSRGNQPWPAIVEKAFIQFPKDSLPNSAGIDGGHSDTASMVLTGEGYEKMAMGSGYGFEHRELVEKGEAKDIEDAKQKLLVQSREKTRTAILNAFTDNSQAEKLKTAATEQSPSKEWQEQNESDGKGSSGEGKVGGIAFGHVYSIVAANKEHIHLRNPWGYYSRVGGKVKPDEAVSILTWDEFYEVFSDVSLPPSPQRNPDQLNLI